MMILLLWLIAAYGMTQIMVYGSIFQSTRQTIEKIGNSRVPVIGPFFNFIHGIVSCMMCCSTWVGFFMGAFVYSIWGTQMGLPTIPAVFFDGMLASGGVWAINTIVEHFEK
jgi:hypothetical protein